VASTNFQIRWSLDDRWSRCGGASVDEAGEQQDASVARRKGRSDKARGYVGACGNEQGQTRRVRRIQSEESECASRVGGVALALILA
jgi:hypothetical protein